MTSKFDAAVNKVLSEQEKMPWYLRAVDKIVPDEWGRVDDKGMAGKGAGANWRGFKKGVEAGSWLIPGTGAVKGGVAAYRVGKGAKHANTARKKIQAARKLSKKGTDAGATILRNPGKTFLGTSGAGLATGMDIKGGPVDTAATAALNKALGDDVPQDVPQDGAEAIDGGTFIPPTPKRAFMPLTSKHTLIGNIKDYWNSLTPGQKTAVSGIGGAAAGYGLYKALTGKKDIKKRKKRNKRNK
jgi:hypothetical protein